MKRGTRSDDTSPLAPRPSPLAIRDGFGRQAAPRHEAANDIHALRDQITELQGQVATLQKEINEKLDQLLARKA